MLSASESSVPTPAIELGDNFARISGNSALIGERRLRRNRKQQRSGAVIIRGDTSMIDNRGDDLVTVLSV